MDPKSRIFRFTLLVFNCMLTFGAYYCIDLPSPIQTELQNGPNSTVDKTDHNNDSCRECLGLGAVKYNLIYSISAWSFALSALLSGYFVDKVGDQVGAFIFSLFVLLGACVFALALTGSLERSAAMFPMMVIGRLLIGAGTSGTRMVQNRVTTFWFKDRELALAYGVVMVFSRFGSVLNFMITEVIADHFGLTWTVWAATMLCGVGFFSALTLMYLDKYGMKKLGMDEYQKFRQANVKLSDVTDFPSSFWFLTVATVAYYSAFLPFIADCSKFYQDKFGLSPTTAAVMEGVVYDVAIVVAPVLGHFVDRFGRRVHALLLGCLLVCVVLALVAFTNIPPGVTSSVMGLSYALISISIWPSASLLVESHILGTAMGMLAAIRGIGSGLMYFSIGHILSEASRDSRLPHWDYVMIFLSLNAGIGVLFSIILLHTDKAEGGILRMSKVACVANVIVDGKSEEEERQPLIHKGCLHRPAHSISPYNSANILSPP